MSIPGVSSTGVSSSSSSSTSSGVVGSSGSTGVSPVTTTLLYTTCSGFPWMSFSCVTVYVAIIVLDSPADKSPICKSSAFTSIPSSSSSTTTFVKSTLPVFVTTMLYSITSPAWTLVSNPMLSPFLLMSETVFPNFVRKIMYTWQFIHIYLFICPIFYFITTQIFPFSNLL